MKKWVLDIIIGVSALIVLSILMLILPRIIEPAAYGYIGALLLFIVYMAVIGLTIVKKSIT